MERDLIPTWEKAVLNVEEASAYMGIGVEQIRALAHAARHGMGDFPAFWVGKAIKVSRRALLQWLDDVAVSHRDLTKAAAMVENATKRELRRGRPRKRIISGGG